MLQVLRLDEYRAIRRFIGEVRGGVRLGWVNEGADIVLPQVNQLGRYRSEWSVHG